MSDGAVIQKRPRKEMARVVWFPIAGGSRDYPWELCPNDPGEVFAFRFQKTHSTIVKLNRFTDKEMLYCATCEEWFPIDEKAYLG